MTGAACFFSRSRIADDVALMFSTAIPSGPFYEAMGETGGCPASDGVAAWIILFLRRYYEHTVY